MVWGGGGGGRKKKWGTTTLFDGATTSWVASSHKKTLIEKQKFPHAGRYTRRNQQNHPLQMKISFLFARAIEECPSSRVWGMAGGLFHTIRRTASACGSFAWRSVKIDSIDGISAPARSHAQSSSSRVRRRVTAPLILPQTSVSSVDFANKREREHVCCFAVAGDEEQGFHGNADWGGSVFSQGEIKKPISRLKGKIASMP